MPLKILKISGNLVTVEADFIINASNTELILGSGVSMAFKRHCGNELQIQMNKAKNQILGKGEIILQGDVIATHSGKAGNFKYALHAAVINYNKGVNQSCRKPTFETIKRILTNIIPYLEWYSNKVNKEIKVVLPYLGCGAGGLDKLDVLKIYENFSKQCFSFECSIIVCDYKS